MWRVRFRRGRGDGVGRLRSESCDGPGRNRCGRRDGLCRDWLGRNRCGRSDGLGRDGLGCRGRDGLRCRGRWNGLHRSNGRGGSVADDGQHGTHVDRIALGHPDLGQNSGRRRRHLGVDFVRRYFEQQLVTLDAIADLLEPFGDRSLGHGFAELGHDDVGH